MPNIVLHIDMFERIRIEKIDAEIVELRVKLKTQQELQNKDMQEINSFQREIEVLTADLMLELIELQKQLHPEDDQADKLREHFEKVNNPPPAEPTKFDRVNEDKALKKLYMKLAKIYHPDVAPENKKEEYGEIFKTLGVLRQAGDLEAMKKFAKTLKKAIMSGGMDINKLKKLRQTLIKQILKIQSDRENFLQSEIYSEMMQYREFGEQYVELHKSRITQAIDKLKEQLEQKNRPRWSSWWN